MLKKIRHGNRRNVAGWLACGVHPRIVEPSQASGGGPRQEIQRCLNLFRGWGRRNRVVQRPATLVLGGGGDGVKGVSLFLHSFSTVPAASGARTKETRRGSCVAPAVVDHGPNQVTSRGLTAVRPAGRGWPLRVTGGIDVNSSRLPCNQLIGFGWALAC